MCVYVYAHGHVAQNLVLVDSPGGSWGPSSNSYFTWWNGPGAALTHILQKETAPTPLGLVFYEVKRPRAPFRLIFYQVKRPGGCSDSYFLG